jgi:hypothetical protein
LLLPLFSLYTALKMYQKTQHHLLTVCKGEDELKNPSQVKPFDQILLEAIDEALYGLGESVKTSIYFHLWDKFEIRATEIPHRLGEFSDALERIFSLGARQLEILFMKNLYSELTNVCKGPADCKWAIPDLTFEEYVHLMRQKFEETSVSEKKVEVFVDATEKQEQYI